MDRIAVEHKIREMVISEFESAIEDSLKGCEIFTTEVLIPMNGDGEEAKTSLAKFRSVIARHKPQARKNVEGALKSLFATASDSELSAWVIAKTSQNLGMFHAAISNIEDTMNGSINIDMFQPEELDPLAALGYTEEGGAGYEAS